MKSLKYEDMENELVFLGEKGQPVTNSLKVAEVFGKRNYNVLRDIRELSCSKEFHKLNFEFMVIMSELPQGGARKTEYCQMTKDGFIFLVMGYTGEKAAAFKESYINAFNEMERRMRFGQPDLSQITRKDLARMLLESENECEQLKKELTDVKSHRTIEPVSVSEERINRLERIVLLALEPLHEMRAEKQLAVNKKEKRAAKDKKEMISLSNGQRYGVLFKNPGSMLLRDMRIKLIEEYNIYFSTKELFQIFRENGWLLVEKDRMNAPSGECSEKGWIVSCDCGTRRTGVRYFVSYVTVKGYEYFSKILVEKGGAQ